MSQRFETSALPVHLTSLVGRERERDTLGAFIRDEGVRLVTLTGPGGVGKTRLALRIATDLGNTFPAGIRFIPLAMIDDATLVFPTIAHVFDTPERVGQPLLERVRDALRGRRFLLILDNFEHVLDADRHVADLLAACPTLHVLVTSRAPLRISGEREFPIPPLAVPEPQSVRSLETLTQVPAIALFVNRAQAVKPGFRLTDATAGIVAAICTRLDGLPLAIELAAARLKVLSPRELLERLEQRLKVLTGGPRDLPRRQQTLRATLDWSYALLAPEEQALFAHFAVFAGGCTLEALEAICKTVSDLPSDVLDGVTALADWSLIGQLDGEGEARLGMLDTIREYARERLTTGGKQDAISGAHAHYYLALAEEAQPEQHRTMQETMLVRLGDEYDNLRAALQWALTVGEAEAALRMCCALVRFWTIRGYLGEGRRWLDRALSTASDVPSMLRATALEGSGVLAWAQGDYTAARSRLEESVMIWRMVGNTVGIVRSLNSLGMQVREQGDNPGAKVLLKESLTLHRELGDKAGLMEALNNLGIVARNQGDLAAAQRISLESLVIAREVGDKQGVAESLNNLARQAQAAGKYAMARTLLEESVAIVRESGDRRQIAHALDALGAVMRAQGDIAEAEEILHESLAMAQDLGDRQGVASCLDELGIVAREQGDYLRAHRLHEESLTMRQAIEDRMGIVDCLEGMVALAALQRDWERAVQLWGAIDALRGVLGIAQPLGDRSLYEASRTKARNRLGEARWKQMWQQGQTLTIDQTITLARSSPPLAQPTPTRQVSGTVARETTYPAGLSAREVEVLRLVAAGKTNREIAEMLFLSIPTVNNHVAHILTKTETANRAEAAAFALRYGLA
jgi:predicted ATPase/DNA-binding CsgD family transcriptional regulator